MKAMILILCLVASSTVWSAVYQRIGGVAANELCDAGTVFKTLKQQAVCDQWHHTEPYMHGEIYEPGTWTCLASHMEHQTISKEIDVCLEFVTNEQFVGCVKMGKGIQSSTVVVEEKVPGVKDNLRYYNYTIPACK